MFLSAYAHAQGGQERVLDTLDLEVQMDMGCHVGAELNPGLLSA